jgi:integrase
MGTLKYLCSGKSPEPEAGRQVGSAEEFRAFLKHVRGDRLYAAWFLAATTGMRRGEVLGLHWRDVDLGAKRVAVTQSLVAVEGDLLFLPPRAIGAGAISLWTMSRWPH